MEAEIQDKYKLFNFINILYYSDFIQFVDVMVNMNRTKHPGKKMYSPKERHYL